MPPRYTYWTIILEGKPTAFRARTQEELLPTLRQLQAKHPDAVLRWFARGRLWESEEEARIAFRSRRPPEERRGPGWRPGGSHEDPRERFKIPRDEKRRRFRDRLRRDPNETREGRPPREERPPRHERPRDRPGGSGRSWPTEGGRDNRFRSGEGEQRPRPPGGGPGWKRDRPTGRGENRGWKPDRPAGRGEGENRGWKPNRPGGKGGDRGWKPGRPSGGPKGHGPGGARSWNPDRQRGGPSSRRGPGRKPGGGGRQGGGGGSSR